MTVSNISHRSLVVPLQTAQLAKTALRLGEQHEWTLPGRHVCVVGGGYRGTRLAEALAARDCTATHTSADAPGLSESLEWVDVVVVLEVAPELTERLVGELPRHAIVIADRSAGPVGKLDARDNLVYDGNGERLA